MGIRPALAVAVAVLALTAGVAGGARPEIPGGSVPRPSPGPVPLPTDAIPVPSGRAVAPVPGGSPVTVSFTLRFRDPGALEGLLANLSDPRSPGYHAFLSPAEFRQRFAPASAEIATTEAVLRAAGASSVQPAPGGLGIGAVLPAAGLESLLGVSLVSFSSPAGGREYTAVGTPTLPASLASIVTGIGGLSDAANRAVARAAVEGPPRPVDQFVRENGTGTQWDVGSDYAEALGATALWPGANSVLGATYPRQIAIATLLAGAYNASTQTDLPAYDPGVVGAYFNATLSPDWPQPNFTGVPVPLPGGLIPPPPGSFGALNDSIGDEVENSLDVEMAGSLAPGASIYTYYFAGSEMVAAGLTPGDLADDFAFDLAAALNASYGPYQHLAVVSGSFGLPEVNDSLWNSELAEATALGVTVVCASGDQGDAPSSLTGRGPATPTWPATATFEDSGAVSVGGATVALSGNATSNASDTYVDAAFDPSVHGIASASGWYETLASGKVAGSEGGVSLLYPEPKWQFDSAAQPAILNATITEGAGAIGRAGPDVALPANNTIAFVFANSTGTIYLEVLGGTSVAAPVFAGLLADVIAVESRRAGSFSPLGFVDAQLYRIASFYAAPTVRTTSLEAGDPFDDIVSGANFLFSAAPGWDPLTGWGLVDAPLLLAALSNATVSDYRYTGPTPTLPSSPAPFLSAETLYLLIGAGALIAIALVLLAAAPSRVHPAPPRTLPPLGPGRTPAPGASGAAGATFACPFCGAERPAEPVRCPQCGRL